MKTTSASSSEQNAPLLSPLWGLTIAILMVVTSLVCTFLSLRVSPIGIGADEVAHIDRSFFRFLHPEQVIHTEERLLHPASGPILQGHQAPLLYWLNAQVLSLLLSPEEVGGIIEYEAGLHYSSQSMFLGGSDRCILRNSLPPDDAHGLRIERSIYALRFLSALFLALSGLAAFLSVRLIFPERPKVACAAAFFTLGMPNAIHRSQFVNNDNLVALLCSLTTLAALWCLIRSPARRFPLHLAAASALAALSFLSKYNGAMAIGVVLIVPLLRADLNRRTRLLGFVAAGTTFALLIAPRILLNISVDGDPLSMTPVIRSCSFLYHPTTFFRILFDRFYVFALFERFFVEFHNPGVLDPEYPLIYTHMWEYLLIAAAVGTVLALISRRSTTSAKRGLLLCTSAVLLAVLALVQMGTSFAMPGGRYFHIVLLPFSVILAAGLGTLLDASRLGMKDVSITIVGAAFFAFGVAFTTSYLSDRLASCQRMPSDAVRAGIEVYPADLDGDGADELFLYRRADARIFVAKREQGAFVVKPEWTRMLALFGDRITVGDIDGDRHGDILIFRPAVGVWFAVDGRTVQSHLPQVARYPEDSAPASSMKTLSGGDAQFFLSDVDGRGGLELLVFSAVGGQWDIHHYQPIPKWWRVPDRWVKTVRGPSNSTPLVIHTAGGTLLGNYEQTKGTMVLFDIDGKAAGTWNLPPGILNFRSSPLAGDPDDALITWKKGDPCLSVFRAEWKSGSGEPRKPTQIQLCAAETENALRTGHAQVTTFQDSDGLQKLAVLDRRTGLIRIFRLEATNEGLSLSMKELFDAGFFNEKTRPQSFAPEAQGSEQ